MHAVPVRGESRVEDGTLPGRGARLLARRSLLWAAFLLVHAVLAFINLNDNVRFPFGDVVQVYRFWMEHAARTGVLVGVDTSWVYPIAALLPMLGAAAFGFDLYGYTWLAIVFALNLGAFVLLIRRSMAAAWWWVAFLAVLGPVALARIDTVTVPFAIVGLLLLASRPTAAAALLAFAAWMKVWPAAVLLAALLTLRERVRVIVGAAAATAAVIAGALLVGSGANVFSFVSEQTGRGLQVEAPISGIWLWEAVFGVPGARVYYDRTILTYQVNGYGVALAASVMTLLLGLAVLAVAACVLSAVRRGVEPSVLLPVASLAVVVCLIAFNKVGSPQFIGWLAAPVVLGLVTGGRSFRVPALLVLAVAATTQLVYPWFYNSVLGLDPLMVSVLTLRNVLLFVVLGWSVRRMVTLPPAGPARRSLTAVAEPRPADRTASGV